MKRLLLSLFACLFLCHAAPAVVTTVARPVSYNGNGSTQSFSFAFDLNVAGELVVTLVDAAGLEHPQTLNSDYTMAPAGNTYRESVGSVYGTVTFTTAPPSGYKIVLSREVSPTQDRNTSALAKPTQIQDAIDKLTLLAQDLQGQLLRAVRFPVSKYATDANIPAGTLSRYLAIDAGGNLVASSYDPASSVLSPAVAAFAALTGGAGLIPYWTTTTAMDTIASTSYGRLNLTDANASAEKARKNFGTINVKDYGAYGDVVSGTDGIAIAADATFTSAATTWTGADVGKDISIIGAGVAGATLSTAIASFTSAHSIELTVVVSTSVNPASFGYGTDDTAAFNAAMDAAKTAPLAAVYVPPGTYLVDKLTHWLASMRLFGDEGSASILKSRLGDHVIEITGLSMEGVELDHLRILGNGGAGHGIYVHDNAFSVSEMKFHDLYIFDTGGKGLYVKDAFTFRGVNLQFNHCGDNAIEIEGGNSSTLTSCYVHVVADHKVAYRLTGQWTLTGCNGIDGGADVDWAVIGKNIAEDGSNDISRVTFLGCNLEEYTHRAVRFKYASVGNFIGCSFIAPATGTVTPLLYDLYPGQLLIGLWISNYNASAGATYTDGEFLHAEGPPFIVIGDWPSSYYPTGGPAYAMPRMGSWYYYLSDWVNITPGLHVDGMSWMVGLAGFHAGLETLNGAASAGFVNGYENSGNGTNKITLAWPEAITSDVTLQIPDKAGTVVVELGTFTTTFDPNNLLTLTGDLGTCAASGVALGDICLVSAPYDLQGIDARAYVKQSGVVKIRVFNGTTGTINLGSGTWKVKVLK